MFKNYLIIAFRNLVANKLYSAINVLGLAIGLTCFILIGLVVRNQLSYDKHWKYVDEVWRVSVEYWNSKDAPSYPLSASSLKLGPTLQLDFPEITHVGRIGRLCTDVALGDIAFAERRCMLADPGIFDIFDFEFVSGDATSALAEPSTAVLTESFARKYFGDQDPLGKTLRIENTEDVRVTGVIQDVPENTHLAADILISLSTLNRLTPPETYSEWEDFPIYTYIRLPSNYDIQQLITQLPAFIERHVYESASEWYVYLPERLTDLHLRSNRSTLMKAIGNLTMVYAFSVIAVFVLVIACINFMNLSVARSMQRAREVGMRKVLGAQRSQLITQFLGEAFLLCAIAALLAIALVEVLLPAFNTFSGLNMEFNYFTDYTVAVTLVGLTISVGLFAGGYAAFYLSAFTPAAVLKGEVTRGKSGAFFRKSLVVFQFAISIGLIIATGVVHAQIRYALDLDLGFRKDQTLIVAGSSKVGFGPSTRVMRDEWLKHPEVLSVTTSISVPGHENGFSMSTRVEGSGADGGDIPAAGIPGIGLGLPAIFVDHNFFEAYGIEIVAGRSFSEDFPTDKVILLDEESSRGGGAFILSELAVKQFGLTPEQAIGRGFTLIDYAPSFRTLARGTIVGVARDFRFASGRETVKPVFYMVPPDLLWGIPTLYYASIRLTGNRLEETLKYIDTTFEKFQPGEIVDRTFLDESFEYLYGRDKVQRKLLMYFALLATFIASMGLYGLASFAADRRTKEIAIRKVMGGTVWDIVTLMTGEFSKLVLIANAIAWPAAYFAMQHWLSGFEYRIDLNPWVFLGAGMAALLLSWLTVGGLAAWIANARPVLALRYE